MVFDTRLVLRFVFSHELALFGATPQVTGSPHGERIIDERGTSILVGRVDGTDRNGGIPSRGASLTTRAAVGRLPKSADVVAGWNRR